jgi:hydrogenase maturation protease
MSGILIAGMGNVFKGDDAFGVEVVQRLGRKALPDGVKVVDFGIRGIDLTYALLDGYRAAVLVDAVQRGGQPGTVYVVEPEWPSGAVDGFQAPVIGKRRRFVMGFTGPWMRVRSV